MEFVELVHLRRGADRLAKLQGDEFANHKISNHHTDEKRRDACADGPECDVGKHIQRFEEVIADALFGGPVTQFG